MRRRILALGVAAVLAVSAPSIALAAPGKDIQEACGVSFGQLVAGGKSSGDAVHQNYMGGAKAFSNPMILAAHGCGGNDQ